MKHVRIDLGGQVLEGMLEGDRVRAGELTVDVGEVQRWLPPVVPSKILATHLTYRSRAEEYRMARLPAQPSYFMKPPSALAGHRYLQTQVEMTTDGVHAPEFEQFTCVYKRNLK